MADRLTDRQIRMLRVVQEYGYVPVSLGDLVDDDFVLLRDQNYLERYSGAGASQRCYLTDKGNSSMTDSAARVAESLPDKLDNWYASYYAEAGPNEPLMVEFLRHGRSSVQITPNKLTLNSLPPFAPSMHRSQNMADMTGRTKRLAEIEHGLS